MTDRVFGTRYRSWPATDDSTATAVAARRHVSELMMPALTLQETALEHNATVMADWVAGLGFDLAPHGKTSMSPELTARQLRHGAWAITAATAGQARIFAGWGVPRIILANEVTDPGSLRWVAQTVAAGAVRLLVLVDSVPGVELLTAALADAGAATPLDVLLEWGIPGGRAGVRDLGAAREVAAAVAASAHVRLVGVECFEGVAGHDRSADDEAAVVAMVADLVTLLAELAAADGFAAPGRGDPHRRRVVLSRPGGGRLRDGRRCGRHPRPQSPAQRWLSHPRPRHAAPELADARGRTQPGGHPAAGTAALRERGVDS